MLQGAPNWLRLTTGLGGLLEDPPDRPLSMVVGSKRTGSNPSPTMTPKAQLTRGRHLGLRAPRKGLALLTVRPQPSAVSG